MSTPLVSRWRSHATLFQPVSFSSPPISGFSPTLFVFSIHPSIHSFIHSSFQLLLAILSVAGPLLEAKCAVCRDEQHSFCLPGAHCSFPGELGEQLNVQGGDHSHGGQRPKETQQSVGISLSRGRESHQWWSDTSLKSFLGQCGAEGRGQVCRRNSTCRSWRHKQYCLLMKIG